MAEGGGLKVERKRRYKVLLPVAVSLEDGSYGYGDEFEHEFTPEDEWVHVDSGLLGLVPEWYEVVSDASIEANLIEAPASLQRRTVQPGETFQAAIPLAREEQLRFHIRRVPPPVEPPPAKPAKPAPSSKKE